MAYIKLVPELVRLSDSSDSVHLDDVNGDVSVCSDNSITDCLHLQAELRVSTAQISTTGAGGAAQ